MKTTSSRGGLFRFLPGFKRTRVKRFLMPDATEDQEPDFHALARLWLARDPRSHLLEGEEKERVVNRLAEALRKRRSTTDHSAQDVGLVVNVDRDHLVPGKGLSDEAFEQLLGFLKERMENPEKSEDHGLEKSDN